LRASKKTLRKAMEKQKKKIKKKKSGMERECLSILKGQKKVSIEERHSKCQKSTKK